MIRQHAVRRFHVASKYPDVSLLKGVVSPEVLEALRGATEQLHRAGVRHALAGGLAVGAWGYPRASKDVDFLVGNEAFIVHGAGFVTFAPGVPITFNGIAIDSLSATPDEVFLAESLGRAVVDEGVPILPIEALIYMKLKSPREKDRVDVIELVKAGIATGPVREWLAKHAPDMARRFEAAVEQARRESDAE
jgi:hypothetical protein